MARALLTAALTARECTLLKMQLATAAAIYPLDEADEADEMIITAPPQVRSPPLDTHVHPPCELYSRRYEYPTILLRLYSIPLYNSTPGRGGRDDHRSPMQTRPPCYIHLARTLALTITLLLSNPSLTPTLPAALLLSNPNLPLTLPAAIRSLHPAL